MSETESLSTNEVLQPPLLGPDPVAEALRIIQLAADPDDPYYLAFSGGKDSVVLLDLARRAGVPFEAHYADTQIDPPEVREFIREYYPEVIWDRPKMPFFKLVVEYGLPTRAGRWCCRELKEYHSRGRRVLIGVRREESVSRRKREVVSGCARLGRLLVLPLLNWSTDQVWHYIRARGLPYLRLYDEGWQRIGCVVCPFVTGKRRERNMRRWPQLWAAMRKACELRWRRHPPAQQAFESPDAMWEWWLEDREEAEPQAALDFV